MRVPVEWLSEYVELTASADELVDRLTMAGLEVEEMIHVLAVELARAGGSPDGRDDRVLITKVTPNRGDWLSVIGTAREVSAITGAKLTIPDPKTLGTGPEAGSLVKISIADPDLCRRYAGMIVRNVTIEESPDWMKNRLIRAGMRPINNVVDITNYVMFELGQPLHAFDYDLLAGHEIIVRRARQGERIVSIDEIERRLEPDMLVIADRDRAVAIAGVMGGYESEVNPDTKHILIESANFDPVSVRRTSKALSMVTESSYRFERCVDPGITDLAARRAAELMQDLAGGEIAEGIVDVFPGKVEPRVIEVRPERVNWLLGTNLAAEQMICHLRALKIAAKLNGRITVTVPTFRPDIEREADVIEEIARIHGYENVGATLPSAPLQGKDSEPGRFAAGLREVLMACGLEEVLTHSLTDPLSVEATGLEAESLAVRNPLSEETSKLRTMLAPGLLQVTARNQAVGVRDLGIFEIGKVYRQSAAGGIEEFRSAAAVTVGSQWASAWNLSKEALAADYYLAKGALESVLVRLGAGAVSFKPARHALLHPTRSALVGVAGGEVGILGELSPGVRQRLDLRGRVCLFELDVDQLMRLLPRVGLRYEPLPRFPAVYRHLAVVVDRSVPYADIRRTVLDSGGEIAEDVDLVDVYTGPQVGENERSLTVSIVFRSVERTLTDEEIGEVLDRVKTKLEAAFGAKFRG